MSNHFAGLSLGPPLGDQRLDLCDLYPFGAPGDPSKTVLIVNANPNADALHPTDDRAVIFMQLNRIQAVGKGTVHEDLSLDSEWYEIR
jgi:hypothetical protein